MSRPSWFVPALAFMLFHALAVSSAPPESTARVFFPEKLEALAELIRGAVGSNQAPGAVLWLERAGVIHTNVIGRRALQPEPEPMSVETVFDAASLTKVVATTPAVMWLQERGRIDLEAPVMRYIPEFDGEGRREVLVRHLLTHTSGLRPGIPRSPDWSGYTNAIRRACAEKLLNAPGTVFRYSDINFILLGELVQRVSGEQLDRLVAREIFRPLGMKDTGFNPPPEARGRIAPTERVEGEMLRGVVHDPTARRMGGVAGHAGLFTTAADLARFARMLLAAGELEGVRVLRPETVALMTRVQTEESVPARRGLGWDIDSPYSRPRGRHFPLGSFGHAGWTGTCLWIDPFSRTFWIFLSNRVHPDGSGNVIPLQAALASVAAEAVVGFNFAGVPGSLPPRPPVPDRPSATPPGAPPLLDVLNGIDVLARKNFGPLKGLRIGLITNHTGADRERRSTIDLLHQAPDVKLVALFSPEHGIRGALDENVSDSRDERTGLPVFSLYGERRSPSPEQLQTLDALVFDIQDIGCRFYTYISTLGLCLEAASKSGLKFFVLDRVNPIGGVAVDGPVLNSETSFTGFHPIPVRHGMTVGELARLFNAERKLNASLTVIPVEGWSRRAWFDETGLPWINPSPNMRGLNAAALYPGIGLLEMTALSVGRGTGTPFEVIGAPYIDDRRLAAELNRSGLPGVRFVPVTFTPTSSVFKGQLCRGVSILLTDRHSCPVIDLGLTIARILHRLHPGEFGADKMDRLLAHRATLDAVKNGRSGADIRNIWTMDLDEFKRRRERHLLYP